MPHLWNTVTLAGDLRHRLHTATADTSVSRTDFEARLITTKYDTGQPPAPKVMTDADPAVAALALEMIETRLRTGELSISTERTRSCTACGHMAGAGNHLCKVCGSSRMCTRALRVLVAERAADRPALDLAHVHAHHKRAPLHLRNIAGNVPARLILSRTRDHGISLEPLGLPGLLLDPRAGLHIAVLAAARARNTGIAVMMLTQNAAANVAAYGQLFLQHDGIRLLYGLHGHVPYDQVPDLATDYQRYRFHPAARAHFETWFLPVYSWHAKNNIGADQLPALLKHFHRAQLATPPEPDDPATQRLREIIQAGGTHWLTRKAELAHVMAASLLARP